MLGESHTRKRAFRVPARRQIRSPTGRRASPAPHQWQGGRESLARTRLAASTDAESGSPRGPPGSSPCSCIGADPAATTAAADPLATDEIRASAGAPSHPARSCISAQAAAMPSPARSSRHPALTASDDHDGAAGFGPATSRVSDNSAHRIRSRAAARISAAETPDAPTLPSASPAASLHHEMPANRRFL